MKKTHKVMSILGGMSVSQFLEEYWQKRPLLIKGAFPNFINPVSPDELAGLACDEALSAYIVFNDSKNQRSGPFSEEDFAKLPEEKWALVVPDLEKYSSEFDGLIQSFNFIAHWRLKALDGSFSAKQGVLSAQDNPFDAFIIHGAGRTRWQIESETVVSEDISAISVNSFENFQAEWILEQGDILYLPSQFSYCSFAETENMTWTVSYRAPGTQEMIQHFMNDLATLIPVTECLSGPYEGYQEAAGMLADTDIDQVLALIRKTLAYDREFVADWFGRYVSQTEEGVEAELLDEAFTLDDIRALCAEGTKLERNPGTRFYFRETLDEVIIYMDGECHALSRKFLPLVILLCGQAVFTSAKIASYLNDHESAEFLLFLINQGYLYFFETEHH